MPLEHYFTNNPNLKSELRKLTYNYKDVHFEFFSDNGVFSKNKVDFASKLLVETFLDTTRDDRDFKMLDVGCGYGFLGIVISKILNVDIELVDVNKRALHLSERNIKLNEVKGRAYESNAYECVKNKYDYIIKNCATYRQAEEEFQIPRSTIYEIVHSNLLTDDEKKKIDLVSESNVPSFIDNGHIK